MKSARAAWLSAPRHLCRPALRPGTHSGHLREGKRSPSTRQGREGHLPQGAQGVTTPRCRLLCPPGGTSRKPCRRRAQPGSALRGATSTALQSRPPKPAPPLHPERGLLLGRIESRLVRQPRRPSSQPACLVPAPTCPAPARPPLSLCTPRVRAGTPPHDALPLDPTGRTRVSSSNPSRRPRNRGPGSGVPCPEPHGGDVAQLGATSA